MGSVTHQFLSFNETFKEFHFPCVFGQCLWSRLTRGYPELCELFLKCGNILKENIELITSIDFI